MVLDLNAPLYSQNQPKSTLLGSVRFDCDFRKRDGAVGLMVLHKIWQLTAASLEYMSGHAASSYIHT